MTTNKAEEHESEQVNLRVAPSRLEVYRRLAKRDGRTLSNWIKRACEAAAVQQGGKGG